MANKLIVDTAEKNWFEIVLFPFKAIYLPSKRFKNFSILKKCVRETISLFLEHPVPYFLSGCLR